MQSIIKRMLNLNLAKVEIKQKLSIASLTKLYFHALFLFLAFVV